MNSDNNSSNVYLIFWGKWIGKLCQNVLCNLKLKRHWQRMTIYPKVKRAK